jgi:hypothetical protein
MRNLSIAVVLGLASLLVGGAGVAVAGVVVAGPLAAALVPRRATRPR